MYLQTLGGFYNSSEIGMLLKVDLGSFFCVQQSVAADVETVALVEWTELWTIDEADRGVYHAAVLGSLYGLRNRSIIWCKQLH